MLRTFIVLKRNLRSILRQVYLVEFLFGASFVVVESNEIRLSSGKLRLGLGSRLLSLFLGISRSKFFKESQSIDFDNIKSKLKS